MRVNVAQKLSETLTALLLAAALLLGGVFAAQQVKASQIYQESMIISFIFSEESLPVGDIITDSRNRDVLLKYVGAVANAYVNFDLVPLGETTSFSAVYESMGPVISIESFEYQRRTLVINGTAPDENGYQEFLRRLRLKPNFSSVTGHSYTSTDDVVRFEIQCTPELSQGYLELF